MSTNNTSTASDAISARFSGTGQTVAANPLAMSTYVPDAEQRIVDAVHAVLDGRGTAEQVVHAFRCAPATTRRMDAIVESNAAMLRLASLNRFSTLPAVSLLNLAGTWHAKLAAWQHYHGVCIDM